MPSIITKYSQADARFAAARANWALVTCEILAAATRFSGEADIPKEERCDNIQ